jgi:pectinesterase
MAFGGYNHVSGDQGLNGRKKKKFAIIGVSSIVLVAMVVAVAVGVGHGQSTSSGNAADSGEVSTSMKAIKAICQPTDYKDACVQSLSSSAGNITDPKELIRVGFQVAINEIKNAMKNSTVLKELEKDPRASKALDNCEELMDYSIDDLQKSFDQLGKYDVTKLDDYVADLKIWLSGSITYQQTCLDGFENTTSNAGESMKKVLKTAGELSRNGLAMVSEISTVLSALQIPGLSRRLLSSEEIEDPESKIGGFPSWVNVGNRRLFLARPAIIKADVVVAKDGSGKYKTVNEALNDIPKKSNQTFVIYIKEGVYPEQVIINKSMTHVMMVGDGPTKTKITGSKNFIDGTPTFKTATVSVIGSNFIAKDMGFENSAGAAKHQAVALRVQSDMSIFYNCQMDGYQDTLYAHAHRQFYRDCTISGTIDFIFGNGAAIFQNCKMVVRKPLENQQCIVTAQGRIDRREPTALVLQNCTITAERAYYVLRKTLKSYLGRPWKEYSRTIIMQSHIDNMIQPEGWLPWMGNFALNTLFYSEYENRGPGSAQTNRVKWRGVKKITPQHAVDFTAGRFIGGDKWIKPTGVPYTSGMMSLLA